MQWYELDPERLEIEIRLMEGEGVNFQLCRDENYNLLWRGPIRVRGHLHRDVRLVYPETFPYEPIELYILEPKLPPFEHVAINGRVCYCRREEWNPDWTALAVYLTAIRFLDEYYSGKMFKRRKQLSAPNFGDQESLFRRILEVLRG